MWINLARQFGWWGYPRQTPSSTTPTRWPRWAWKWKKWTQLQSDLHNSLFFSQKVLEMITLVFLFSERVGGFADPSWSGSVDRHWKGELLSFVGRRLPCRAGLVSGRKASVDSLQSCPWSVSGGPRWGWASSASSSQPSREVWNI